MYTHLDYVKHTGPFQKNLGHVEFPSEVRGAFPFPERRNAAVLLDRAARQAPPYQYVSVDGVTGTARGKNPDCHGVSGSRSCSTSAGVHFRNSLKYT